MKPSGGLHKVFANFSIKHQPTYRMVSLSRIEKAFELLVLTFNQVTLVNPSPLRTEYIARSRRPPPDQ